nr:MAG TPA: rubredoxin [Caudoviricetes sp.]
MFFTSFRSSSNNIFNNLSKTWKCNNCGSKF